MADIRVARDFFEEYLPQSVLSIVSLNTLKLSQNSFVDESLDSFSADVLYEVGLNNGELAYLYLLCEHLSSVSSLMPFRLLNYKVKIWHFHLQQTGEERLPLIFPLVFYHGKKPYDGPRSLAELIQGPPELVQEVLSKPFHLVDTHDIKDEDLRRRQWAGVLTFIFKHVYARDIWPYLETAIEMLQAIKDEKGAALFINHLLKYWLLKAEIKENGGHKAFIEMVEREISVGGEGMTTIAERFRQDGREEGREEARREMRTIAERFRQDGREEGREEVRREMRTIAERFRQDGREEGKWEGIKEGEAALLMRLLERKFKVVPAYYKQQIEHADPECLLKWSDKLLESKTLEEVFKAEEQVFEA